MLFVCQLTFDVSVAEAGIFALAGFLIFLFQLGKKAVKALNSLSSEKK
jgi:hypothetical protein